MGFEDELLEKTSPIDEYILRDSGGSCTVTVPKSFITAAGLVPGDKIEIRRSVGDGALLILRPVKQPATTEE